MVQGSVVALSCDLEMLLWGQGPGTRSGNGEQQALHRKAVTWHSNLSKPQLPSVKNESETPARGASQGSQVEEGATALWAHPGSCLRVKDVSTVFRDDPPGVRGKLGGTFFPGHIPRTSPEGMFCGTSSGECSSVYNQPLPSKHGMNRTGAQQAFSNSPVTQPLLPTPLRGTASPTW